jgi:hypothetical protein
MISGRSVTGTGPLPLLRERPDDEHGRPGPAAEAAADATGDETAWVF